MDEHLLEVKNLKVSFKVGKKKLTAVDNVTFSLDRGKVIGIVGESGCGKSVTATSIMRLVSPSVCEIDENSQILFEGEDLSKASEARMRKVRGNEISMIFQEPMSSLNPVYRIGDQMVEMIRTHHREIPKKEALKQCIEMLARVGIPSPEQRIREFPHQMSGGMRQRVMIAMALLCQPKLLIADEPTTALDVTIQAQILRILKKLAEESDTSVILITHDMGVVAEMADHVMVMYAGKSVEYGTAEDIFDHPMHPYTVGNQFQSLEVVRKIICLRSRDRFRGWMRCRPDADFLRDVHMQRSSAKKKTRECREKQDILYDASGLWIPRYRIAGRWNNGDPFIGNPGCKKIFSGKKSTWKGNYSKSGGFH